MVFNKFKLGKGQLGFIVAIRDSKDPVIFTVLLEDTAAALGLVVAFLGINELRTMHLGPEDSLVNISVDFADRLTSSDVEAGISELEQEIKTSYPEAKRVFIETQSRSGHHASLENAPEV